jgi:hypothetical protein
MKDDSRAPRRISPEKLMDAIRSKGLTFSEAARRARKHLPADSRLSHTSIWSYATGRASPKRLSYIEAIEKSMEVEPHGLSDPVVNRAPAMREPIDPVMLPEPSISVVDNGDGSTFFNISATVPWSVAIVILEKLKGGK